MKKIIGIISLLLLSACAVLKPRPEKLELQESHRILGKNWEIGCSMLENKMPGSSGSSYGIVSLYSRDKRPVLSPLRIDKVWFYQKDSLVGTWDDFDKNWQNANANRLNYYCRKLGRESHFPCDKAVVRFRSIFGRSYTLAVPAPRMKAVY